MSVHIRLTLLAAAMVAGGGCGWSDRSRDVPIAGAAASDDRALWQPYALVEDVVGSECAFASDGSMLVWQGYSQIVFLDLKTSERTVVPWTGQSSISRLWTDSLGVIWAFAAHESRELARVDPMTKTVDSPRPVGDGWVVFASACTPDADRIRIIDGANVCEYSWPAAELVWKRALSVDRDGGGTYLATLPQRGEQVIRCELDVIAEDARTGHAQVRHELDGHAKHLVSSRDGQRYAVSIPGGGGWFTGRYGADGRILLFARDRAEPVAQRRFPRGPGIGSFDPRICFAQSGTDSAIVVTDGNRLLLLSADTLETRRSATLPSRSIANPVSWSDIVAVRSSQGLHLFRWTGDDPAK